MQAVRKRCKAWATMTPGNWTGAICDQRVAPFIGGDLWLLRGQRPHRVILWDWRAGAAPAWRVKLWRRPAYPWDWLLQASSPLNLRNMSEHAHSKSAQASCSDTPSEVCEQNESQSGMEAATEMQQSSNSWLHDVGGYLLPA